MTAELKLKDPVCNMDVSSTTEYQYSYGDHQYYFCCEQCLNKFKKNPTQYLNKKVSIPASAPDENASYTCPMHPEIIANQPGDCPKCGMALESVTLNVEEDNSELNDMQRRLWLCTFFAVPVFLLAM